MFPQEMFNPRWSMVLIAVSLTNRRSRNLTATDFISQVEWIIQYLVVQIAHQVDDILLGTGDDVVGRVEIRHEDARKSFSNF